MQRLRDHVVVTLSPSEERGRPLTCRVVAVGRTFAALLPLPGEPADERASGPGWYLVFDVAGRPVALRGRVDVRAADDVRFVPTDDVQLPRRNAPRLRAAVPMELAGRPATTVNVSSEGVLVEDPGGIDLGVAVPFALELGEGEAVAGTATPVRRDGDRVALTLDDLPDPVRERIDEHVITAARTLLVDALRAVGTARRPARPTAGRDIT